MTMNKKIKEKWIANLRSGKFVQGKYQLKATPSGSRTLTEFCCLGVLCETMGVGYKNVSGAPCSATLKKAGLTKKDTVELIKMNDDLDKSFKQIANFIEKNF